MKDIKDKINNFGISGKSRLPAREYMIMHLFCCIIEGVESEYP